ncbi:NADP-dependent oxidoreductase domain-containing protein [Stachybotrys elegans]|uniref:NADP-dependent oxidoreductase domain-containing protein n=1 Tax=Stachybotrys elegans TaxID=80388 RepID=A0A8K0T502_9HYPO|nr:NADP-dependent oxidoreductase domain-containing protein [Stachybotrys elegans]
MTTIMNKSVGQIGFGLMGLSWRPDPPPLEQAIETLKAAYNKGSYLWNGAEFYGTPEYNSMTIIRHYFEKYPEDAEKVVIIIKGGAGLTSRDLDGSPEGIRRSIDNILAQLGGKKKLDLFSIARRDHKNPWDVTLNTIKKEYIDTGKIGGFSLSECSADTVEQAAKILPVHGAEVELSMFTPDILNNGIAAACAKYNIPIVAYSPLGRGILTGRFKGIADVVPGSVGSRMPRLQAETIEHNLKLTQQLETLAEKKGCSTGQLAIAWAVAVGKQPGQPPVIPIPGASSVKHAEENLTAVELTEEEYKTIADMVNNFKPAGGRYPQGAHVNT